MRTNTFLLFLLFVRLLNAHDETPTAYGYYLSGIKQVNKLIVFSGAGSMDNDNQDHGQTPAWYWDFDYQGSFVADKVTSSTITTYTFILPGTYTVGLRYKDNDGTLSTVYTFEIEIVELLRYYYLKDHLGNIRMTIDENGETAGYDDYYPFGMMMDNRRGNTANPDDKYKYSGKEYDTETGYSYFGARSYDARIGRWLSVDPLMDKYPGWSPYNYVMNNPLVLVDPDGMRVGDYYSENGRFVGTDGINDNNNYVVPDRNLEFVQNALESLSILRSENYAYQAASSNSVLLVDGRPIRQIEQIVNTATPWNEVGGAVVMSIAGVQKVIGAVPGKEVTDPCNAESARIDVDEAVNRGEWEGFSYKVADFHLHPSGTIKAGNVVCGFYQPPSAEDIRQAGEKPLKLNRYVISDKVYIYNGNGILVTFPKDSFFKLGR